MSKLIIFLKYDYDFSLKVHKSENELRYEQLKSKDISIRIGKKSFFIIYFQRLII